MTNYSGKSGEIIIDEFGDRLGNIQIMNIQNGEFMQVCNATPYYLNCTSFMTRLQLPPHLLKWYRCCNVNINLLSSHNTPSLISRSTPSPPPYTSSYLHNPFLL